MQTFRVAVLYALGLLLMGCQSTPSKTGGRSFGAVEPPVFLVQSKARQQRGRACGRVLQILRTGGLRDGLHGVLQNIGLPVSFANDVLQLEFKRAGTAAERFGVNTTVGILGWNDRATEMGLPSQPEDFGQTLGVYGTPGGPYLVLPLFGPTLPRDAVGRIFVDHYFSPLGYVSYSGKYYVLAR
ncbi:MAG: MlaA family lipoprotein [Rhizomicrobium sp.]